MSFTFTQANSATSSGAPHSLACTFTSSNPVVGDLIVVGVSSFVTSGGPAPTVTDNFGNTYTQIAITSTFGGGAYTSLWYTIVATTGASFTVTASWGSGAAYVSLGILDFVPSGTPSLDGSSSNQTSAASLSLTSGSFNTSGAADVIVCVGEGRSNGQTWTAGGGATIAVQLPGVTSNGTSLCVQYLLGVAAGAQNPGMTMTQDGTAGWGCIGAGFTAGSVPFQPWIYGDQIEDFFG